MAGQRLAQRLRHAAATITVQIVEQLRNGQAPSYRRISHPLLGQRVQALLEALCVAVGSRQPLGFARHVGKLAGRRRDEGYALAELQAALNALQATGWRLVVESPGTEGQRLAELERLTATVGAAKDLLAHCGLPRYRVDHPSRLPPLTALFKGTISGPA